MYVVLTQIHSKPPFAAGHEIEIPIFAGNFCPALMLFLVFSRLFFLFKTDLDRCFVCDFSYLQSTVFFFPKTKKIIKLVENMTCTFTKLKVT